MRISGFILLSLLWFVAPAQEVQMDSLEKNRFQYYFQLQSGALIGCNDCSKGKQVSFTTAFNNGIKIGKYWQVGGGIGFDSYANWNLLPVFVSTAWEIHSKKNKNALFLQFDYGDAIGGWKPIQYDYEEYGLIDTRYGRMYSYSIGYRIKYDQLRISFGLGRKSQRITSFYEYPTYYWNNNLMVMGDPSRKEVTSNLNRLMIWMTIGLN